MSREISLSFDSLVEAKEKTFFFRDIMSQDLSYPGLYSWYFCPRTIRFETKQEILKYHYEYSKICSKIFEYKIISSDDHFSGVINPIISTIDFKKPVTDFINNLTEDEVSHVHKVLPYLYLNLPPLRVGVAVKQSLQDRLLQYRYEGPIREAINHLGTSKISIDDFLIRTQKFVSNFENNKEIIEFSESWILSTLKPVLNKET